MPALFESNSLLLCWVLLQTAAKLLSEINKKGAVAAAALNLDDHPLLGAIRWALVQHPAPSFCIRALMTAGSHGARIWRSCACTAGGQLAIPVI